MQHNTVNISPMEKIIAILSYFTMAVIGIIWIILAYILKRKIRPFLMYHIVQSIIISLIYWAILKLLKIILQIISMIPFVDIFAACINFIISFKVLTTSLFSFSIFQIFLSFLLLYIITGVILGRIFYVSFLSNLVEKVMKLYNR